jgi:hypothetical protein
VNRRLCDFLGELVLRKEVLFAAWSKRIQSNGEWTKMTLPTLL